VSGTSNTVSTPALTDANGQTTATVKSTVAGTKTVTASVGTTTISQQPTVTFAASAANMPTLTITSIEAAGSKAVVSWPGSNSWYYTVEFAPSLLPLVTWSNLAPYVGVPGWDGTMSATNAIDGHVSRFYRVKMTR
jgi:hypothetical protein